MKVAKIMISSIGISLGISNAPSPVFNLFAEVTDVQAGDTFTETKDIEGGGKMVTVYTFAGIQSGVAIFTFTSNGTVIQKITQGVEAIINTTTKISGEISVNATTGLLIKKTTNTELTGKLEMQGMEIPTTSNMVTTIVVTSAQ